MKNFINKLLPKIYVEDNLRLYNEILNYKFLGLKTMWRENCFY